MTLQHHNPLHPGGADFRPYIEPFEGISCHKVTDFLGIV